MKNIISVNRRLRKNFAKIPTIIGIPNLIDIQKSSFETFLQTKVPTEARKNIGLRAVFKSVFPIKDMNETASLEFVSYTLDTPKYDVIDCRQRGMTFAAPIRIKVRLVVWDVHPETKARTIRDVKEKEVYFGEIPLMTEHGTFIVNGTERVIVSQLHRSPGVFFEYDKKKAILGGRILFSARIIPVRGSWLDFEFDHKDLMYVRIDRRKKFYVTTLLRALGYSTEELLNHFYQSEIIISDGKKFSKKVEPDLLKFQVAQRDINDPKTEESILRKGKRFNQTSIERMKEAGIKTLSVAPEELRGRVVARDIISPSTGEVLVACNEPLTDEAIEKITSNSVKEFPVIYFDTLNVSSCLRDTISVDKILSKEEAIEAIYRRLRPGEPPTMKMAVSFFDQLFFNADRYDLSKVGRLKINRKLGFQVSLEHTTLKKEDILDTVKFLFDLRNGKGFVDDIDHLGNRRVRGVGELLENQYRIGVLRMARAAKERMTLHDVGSMMPDDLINPKPVSAVVREFFGSSQLSQFMDQTNPLSEVTHKRRLSALGPGGLTRERAGFEVRDVHPTHYGRICPIETPEGANIGLIASLSTYARVNEFGFIETPYRLVEKGRALNEVKYLSALEEESYAIAQANAHLDKKGHFVEEVVSVRKEGEFTMVPREEVQFMDVSPTQLVSVAAALVPFLEHDDANRALMGSNMQRQAVPLLKAEAPLIGTGVERIVACDSGVTVLAKRSGIVESVDSSRIVIRGEGDDEGHSGVDIYTLVKFQRSNQNTCINQKPIVKSGQKVRRGEVIADGPATDYGELALGRNVLVAFMTWEGYNFEDSVLISERLVRDDVFTSIHIEEFECTARDTKLGEESITRDIPNVGEDALKDLDERGLIRIGAEVRPGDILVGKITPKGETQLTPEEKLLRAIFGDKAREVQDTSLKVPPGISGTVISVRVFSSKSEKELKGRDFDDQEVARLLKDQEEEMRIIKENAVRKAEKILIDQKSAVRVSDERKKKIYLKRGETISKEQVKDLSFEKFRDISLINGKEAEEKLARTLEHATEQLELVKMVFEEKIARIKKGDELPPGVLKLVKVSIAMKRKISVGDKMAGRHGNKGVVSKILPEEDMPFFDDGTPVDVVLNPLGVPSRMNVGQILETHLGWASKELGQKIGEIAQNGFSSRAVRSRLKSIYSSPEVDEFLEGLDDNELKAFTQRLAQEGIHMLSPAFDGAKENEIKELLKEAGLPLTGQTMIRDGRTGEYFKSPVTVGIMYKLKLHHLVDDKIHARSIGPYSLVTQQPLGGKAQFGGQRLGEMEVWALEAYGAANALQEFLTVKSDDVSGRTRMYESIVKGKHLLEPGLPESFNVLVKELQSLALDFQLIEEEGGREEEE